MTQSNFKTIQRLAMATMILLVSCPTAMTQDTGTDNRPVDSENTDGVPAVPTEPDPTALSLGDDDSGESEPEGPQPESTTPEWTTGKLVDLLNGKADPPEGWPKGLFELRVVRQVVVKQSNGKKGTRPVIETQRIDAKDNQLTSFYRHAICVMQFDSQIQELRGKLDQSTDPAEEQELLDQLAKAYSARFKIDTVFQDIKVKEIEQRAQKLRDELTARDESEKAWVKAMMTLAEMRADGIDTMQGAPYATAPTVYSDFAPRRTASDDSGFDRPALSDPRDNRFAEDRRPVLRSAQPRLSSTPADERYPSAPRTNLSFGPVRKLNSERPQAPQPPGFGRLLDAPTPPTAPSNLPRERQ